MWLNLEWCVVLGGLLVEPWRKKGLVVGKCLHVLVYKFIMCIFAHHANKFGGLALSV